MERERSQQEHTTSVRKRTEFNNTMALSREMILFGFAYIYGKPICVL